MGHTFYAVENPLTRKYLAGNSSNCTVLSRSIESLLCVTYTILMSDMRQSI